MYMNAHAISLINAAIAHISANFGHRLTPENKTAIAAYDFEAIHFEVYDYGNNRFLKVYENEHQDILSIHIGERPEQVAPEDDTDPDGPEGGTPLAGNEFEYRYAKAA